MATTMMVDSVVGVAATVGTGNASSGRFLVVVSLTSRRLCIVCVDGENLAAFGKVPLVPERRRRRRAFFFASYGSVFAVVAAVASATLLTLI